MKGITKSATGAGTPPEIARGSRGEEAHRRGTEDEDEEQQQSGEREGEGESRRRGKGNESESRHARINQACD